MAMLDNINELASKRSLINNGDSEAVSKQHGEGKLTARERLLKLFDEDSFVEIGAFVEVRNKDFSLQTKKAYGDGVVTGYGTIDGRLVYASSQDFTVIAGSLGEMNSKKIINVIEMAVKTGAPYINIIDSNGARLQEGLDALAGYGMIYKAMTNASGVIPLLSLIMGPCVGAAAYISSLSDFTFMVEKTSYMCVTGSQITSEIDGKTVTTEDLGGAEANMKNGNVDFAFENDDACIANVRDFIGYLPDNNLTDTPEYVCEDDVNRVTDNLNEDLGVDYPVADIINSIVDNGSYVEIQKEFATNIVIGFARFNGSTVGIAANQQIDGEGILDADSAEKLSRFIRFCDAFNISVVTLTDISGVKVGAESEHNGLAKSIAKVIYSFADATVPKINIIIGRAYGGAYVAMNSKPIGADIVYAWPNADIAVMPAESVANIVYRKEISASDDPVNKRKEMAETYRNEYANPYVAASKGYVDDIIEPGETRIRIISALEMLASKRVQDKLAKKHGNIPL